MAAQQRTQRLSNEEIKAVGAAHIARLGGLADRVDSREQEVGNWGQRVDDLGQNILSVIRPPCWRELRRGPGGAGE
jgi:hypothetical protein